MVRARKAETAAILDLLNDEWADEAELAQALLDRFFELLADRNLYGVKWGAAAYGPFITKQSAEKLCRALDGAATAHHLQAANTLVRIVEKVDPEDRRYCAECKHPRFAHSFPNHKGCLVKNCTCEEDMR